MEIELPFNWSPRAYQMPVWRYFQDEEEGKRGACVWHRRAGKDLLAINLISTKAIQRVGTYWHLLPTYKQGRSIVWNGFTRDGRKFLDHFHPDLIADKNNTEMRITFKNGSMYQVVGTDNIDSLVGTNPIGCVFSEYSLHDPGAFEYLRPILSENGGFALFIYTARGKNHGYRLIEMAKRNPAWFSEILKAGSGPDRTKRDDGSPVISDEMIQAERDAGMPEEMVDQEFFCSFEAPLVGGYYSSQMTRAMDEGRVTSVPWEPRLQVNTYWDIGRTDATAIWFVQFLGLENRVIDYYECSGEGLPHYIRVMRGQMPGYERMSEYVYGQHFAPHDIDVVEWTTNKARRDVARSLGLRFRPTPQHLVEDGIEAVRNILPTCYFDAVKCERGLEALKSYRKEWDEKKKIFGSTPVHDWASHGADAFRIFAWSHRPGRYKMEKLPDRAVDEYEYV